MFRLIRLAIYGFFGYAVYQTLWGSWFEESGRPRPRRQSRRRAGRSGQTHQIQGKLETVMENNGTQHMQTVGRGVIGR